MKVCPAVETDSLLISMVMSTYLGETLTFTFEKDVILSDNNSIENISTRTETRFGLSSEKSPLEISERILSMNWENEMYPIACRVLNI
ncbi:hypothetical protein TNCT_703851 [Trichonephila clavata]|uniref:Uncharacterized protein n=1 Tax=Trichonephila clavata TaxID=2740835 RepID=A0A8X6ISZ8_TRICU|nr:hypothetical protein TNCT_703851 [Trichonephila clavata]